MSTMVEKVARAIYDKATTFDGDQIAVHLGHSCIIDMSSRDSEELKENVMSVCRDAARSAMEAMMKPTDTMVQAGVSEDQTDDVYRDVPAIFTAMIQAALKEEA